METQTERQVRRALAQVQRIKVQVETALALLEDLELAVRAQRRSTGKG